MFKFLPPLCYATRKSDNAGLNSHQLYSYPKLTLFHVWFPL